MNNIAEIYDIEDVIYRRILGKIEPDIEKGVIMDHVHNFIFENLMPRGFEEFSEIDDFDGVIEEDTGDEDIYKTINGQN